MTNDQIQQIALSNGFKLKQQPDGSMALNPYVFDFAQALIVSSGQSIPEGWKLVPVEPTGEMVDALLTGQPEHKRTDIEIRRYFAYIYKLALAAAPTLPTQEDKPVAYMDTFYNRLVWPDQIVTNSEGRMQPLYTRQDNSELRKAAEEACDMLEGFLHSEWLGTDQERQVVRNLRAALEGK